MYAQLFISNAPFSNEMIVSWPDTGWSVWNQWVVQMLVLSVIGRTWCDERVNCNKNKLIQFKSSQSTIVTFIWEDYGLTVTFGSYWLEPCKDLHSHFSNSTITHFHFPRNRKNDQFSILCLIEITILYVLHCSKESFKWMLSPTFLNI